MVDVHILRPCDLGLLEARRFEDGDPGLKAYLDHWEERGRLEGVTVRVVREVDPPKPRSRYSVLTDDET